VREATEGTKVTKGLATEGTEVTEGVATEGTKVTKGLATEGTEITEGVATDGTKVTEDVVGSARRDVTFLPVPQRVPEHGCLVHPALGGTPDNVTRPTRQRRDSPYSLISSFSLSSVAMASFVADFSVADGMARDVHSSRTWGRGVAHQRASGLGF
jgi:hypothetical protein